MSHVHVQMQLSAGEVLADAMMALLPGLDANDEHKALAVLRFYTTVLSSLPSLEVAHPPSRALFQYDCL
jgi:hypothetical protein